MIEELPEGDPRVARVESALRELSEHFDSVRIFATVHDPDGGDSDGTHAITRGYGNWYATFGFVTEWAERQNERSRQTERGN